MQWYLMNDVQISTLGRKYAGELVDDSVQSLTPIQAAGGVLLPASNPTIAAAAAIAQFYKKRGQGRLATQTMLAAGVNSRAGLQLLDYQFGTASTTAITETTLGPLFGTGSIAGVFFLPNATSTPGAGSNSQVLTATMYNASGGSGVTLGTLTIANATPATKWVRATFAGLASPAPAFAAGYSVTIQSALTGTATVPAGIFVVAGFPTGE